MLHAFALSSAASSARKPPESERCTTCRRVVDGLRRVTYTGGGGIVPSQGQGFRGRFSRSSSEVRQTHASGWQTPLAIAQGGGSHVTRRVPTMCVTWVKLRSELRGALRSRSTPTCSNEGGRPLGRAKAPIAARPRKGGWQREGSKGVVRCRRASHSRFAEMSEVLPQP